MKYTLYWATNTCSLSPHITLREAGLPFDLVKVDLRTKKLVPAAGSQATDGDWLAINPKGYVPALRLPTGEILTEGAVMVQYIADQVPEKKLAPPHGTMERVRLAEWLHFIATELHKGMSPLYNPAANEEFKTALKEKRLIGRWTTLAEGLGDKPYLTGAFTIADAYAFYVMRAWQGSLKETLARWSNLAAYYQRIAERPHVAAALAAESA